MDPFRGVWFRPDHPPHPVEPHRVLMQFGSDEEAATWRAWWATEGAEEYAQYLKRREQSRERRPIEGESER